MSTFTVDTSYPRNWTGDLPLFASRPWLDAMAGRIEGDSLWLTLRSNHGDVGFAAYVIRDPSAYPFGNLAALTASPDSPFATTPVRRQLTTAAVHPTALFPHLLLTWPGYMCFPVGGRRDDPAAVRAALDHIRHWAAGQGIAAVAIPYAGPGVLSDVARGSGFAAVPLTQEATLPIPDGGFPGYLDGLHGHRRRRIAGERRAWLRRGDQVWRVDSVTPSVLDRLAQLRAAHRDRYGIAGDPAAERTRIATVLDRLGDLVDVFAVGESRDEIRCFALFVRDGTTWHALYFGSDGSARSRGDYFEAVFYTPLDTGGDLGLRRISFGLGASEAKQLRGCRMEPVDCLLEATAERARQPVAAIVRAWRHHDQPAEEAS